MISKQAKIANQHGIHCRPAAVIVKEARDYQGRIRVVNETGNESEASNALGLLALGLTCGKGITIEVEGPDENATCDKMVELFEREFDFDR